MALRSRLAVGALALGALAMNSGCSTISDEEWRALFEDGSTVTGMIRDIDGEYNGNGRKSKLPEPGTYYRAAGNRIKAKPGYDLRQRKDGSLYTTKKR